MIRDWTGIINLSRRVRPPEIRSGSAAMVLDAMIQIGRNMAGREELIRTREQFKEAMFLRVGARKESLMLAFVSHPFKNDRAREFATHGLARRVEMLACCIENVFDNLPPDYKVRLDAERAQPRSAATP